MKLTEHEASETERALKAVCKRLDAREKKKDEARGEEAAQSGQQQECILSGGVYLRHRLRKPTFLKNRYLSAFSTQTLYPNYVRNATCWRTGVLACKKHI